MYLIIEALALAFIAGALWLLVEHRTVNINSLKNQRKTAEIIKILRDSSRSSLHPEAIAALGELGDPIAIEPLFEALDGPNPELAARSLAQIGGQAIPLLAARLNNGPDRQLAATALIWGGAAAHEYLKAALLEKSAEARQTAASALDRLHWAPEKNSYGAAYWLERRNPLRCIEIGAPAIALLVEALNDPELRNGAIQALGEIGDKRTVGPLLRISAQEGCFPLSLEALVKIGRSALPELVGALQQEPDIRPVAVAALDRMNWRPGLNLSAAYYWAYKREWGHCVDLGSIAVAPLAEALASDNADVRCAAATALGQIGGPEAVQPLIANLKQDDQRTKLAIILALGETKQGQAVGPLIGCLAENETLSNAAIEALVKIGHPALNGLVQVLYDDNLQLMTGAARALSQIGWKPGNDRSAISYHMALGNWEECIRLGEDAVEPLISALKEPKMRLGAALSLGKLGDERAVEPLLEAIRQESDPVNQQRLCSAFSLLGAAAMDPLLAGLQTEALDMSVAAMCLGWIGDPEAVGPLAEVVNNRQQPWQVRKAAALALGEIGTPAIPALLDALRAKEIEPRGSALLANAFGKIGVPAMEPLLHALRMKDIDAYGAVLALGKIKDPHAVPGILDTLRGKRFGNEVRKVAIWSLENIGAPGIPVMARALCDPASDHDAILQALEKIGSPAVDAMINALNQVNPEVRECIVKSLGRIGDPRAANALQLLLRNQKASFPVVRKALDELGKRRSAASQPSKTPFVE